MSYFDKTTIIKSQIDKNPLGVVKFIFTGDKLLYDFSFSRSLVADEFTVYIFIDKRVEKIFVGERLQKTVGEFYCTNFTIPDAIVVAKREGDLTLVGFADGLKVYTATHYFEQVKKEFIVYDDFALAEENYYEKESFYDEHSYTKNAIGKGSKEQSAKEEVLTPNSCQDEDNFIEAQQYYLKHEKIINGAFSQYRLIESLTKIVPNGRFYNVVHAEKEYVFGIIKQNKKVKYLCYGIEGSRGVVPQRLKDKACFLPSDIFNTDEGYYFIFQSADSGKIILPQN